MKQAQFNSTLKICRKISHNYNETFVNLSRVLNQTQPGQITKYSISNFKSLALDELTNGKIVFCNNYDWSVVFLNYQLFGTCMYFQVKTIRKREFEQLVVGDIFTISSIYFREDGKPYSSKVKIKFEKLADDKYRIFEEVCKLDAVEDRRIETVNDIRVLNKQNIIKHFIYESFLSTDTTGTKP